MVRVLCLIQTSKANNIKVALCLLHLFEEVHPVKLVAQQSQQWPDDHLEPSEGELKMSAWNLSQDYKLHHTRNLLTL